MVFLEKHAHLVLKRPFPVVRLLRVDIPQQRSSIGRRHRKCSIPTLPRESFQPRSLRLQPSRRRRLHLADHLRDVPIRMNTDRQMHMIGNTTHAKTIAPGPTHHSGEIGRHINTHRLRQQRFAVLRTENHMNQNKRQRLRHGIDDRSGIQPSAIPQTRYLGLAAQAGIERALGATS